MSSNSLNIGLITYHAAYNYGSVLQAYATQEKLERLGHTVTMIDYRSKEGARYYENLYFRGQGVQSFLADLTTIPVAHLRKQRMQKFENFISNKIHLSAFRYHEPDELNSLAESFDVAVSGSDQIINKHSNELERVDWRYMNPYLLRWAKCRKISYASSPATMTDDDLKHIADALADFSALSAREQSACYALEKITGKHVEHVCDPTLLLSANDWMHQISVRLPEKLNEGRYLFFYSLVRPKRAISVFQQLKQLSDNIGMPIAVLTPMAGNVPRCDELINVLDAGPNEFLGLIKYARGVITDSYHGTLFSINFNKQFLVYSENSVEHELNTRRGQILKELSLTNQIITELSPESLQELNTMINYQAINESLEEMRSNSSNYLIKALNII